VGVGGPLTGNPVDIAVIDDPIKDAVEGQSATDRNRKWEWYNEVLSTRLHNDSRVLLTMTRWHEDDLAGRILAHERDRWDVVTLPYIKDTYTIAEDMRSDGEALWPERHSAEKAAQMKSNSPRTYEALLQQRPAPLDGGIFKRDYWRYYDRLPQRVDRLVMSWDCSFKGDAQSDYVVGMVLAKSGQDTFVVDVVRGKWDFTRTLEEIEKLSKAYPYTQEKFIEDKANGTAIINVLRTRIPGIIPVTPRESKESRASAVSYIIESGHVYLPRSADWLESALYEFSAFPNGANDDIVDALTQGLNKLYITNDGTAYRVAV
jgi:predicted phage terminase large subunit-like protein